MQPALAALRKIPGAEVKRRLDADGALLLETGEDGAAPVRIEAGDLAVESRALAGRAAAASGVAAVELDTALTNDLRREGKYRELLNRVQTLRKELDLPYTARIRLGIAGADGGGDLYEVAREREAHFREETLSVEVVPGDLPGADGGDASDGSGPSRREIEVEGERATLTLEVAAP